MQTDKFSSIFLLLSTSTPPGGGGVVYAHNDDVHTNDDVGYIVGDNSTANWTANTTAADDPEPSMSRPLWQTIIIIIICSIIIINTILGNMLVCLSVILVNRLRTASNSFIVSLAVSDCLVGLLVMPFAAIYEVSGTWMLGKVACDFWTSMDVFLCTASILNLCFISIDRYFVITRPLKYAQRRTTKLMAFMITCVWLLAGVVSIPPLLIGWRANTSEGDCQLSDSIIYQLYATMCAFYFPLLIMIFVYYKIFAVSHAISRKEAKSQPSRDLHEGQGRSSGVTTPLKRDSNDDTNHIYHANGKAKSYKNSDASKSSIEVIIEDVDAKRPNATCCGIFSRCCHKPSALVKQSKAIKTLGVIMGAFIACWLPFFILALIKPFLPDDVVIPHWLNSLFLWCGYTNSFLNPIIYARFNREFRQPFKEIILCRCRNINVRMRRSTYVEQFGDARVSHAHSRHSLNPPQSSAVRYDSGGQTRVMLSNGNSFNNNGAKL